MVEPELSIVICTCNRYDLLPAAIAAVEQQDLGSFQYELIIVDNSTDIVAQQAFRSVFDCACQSGYLVETAPGLARARNLGVAAAAAPLVAFIDDDARPARHWAGTLIDAFADRPEVAIAGGPVRPIWMAEKPPWLTPALEEYLSVVDRGRFVRELDAGEWLAGTNIAFRKNTLKTVGGFDPTLGRRGGSLLSNEEIKACNDIRALGFRTLYLPKADVQHVIHADRLTQAWMRRRFFWQAVSDVLIADSDKAPEGSGVAGSASLDILTFLSLLPPRHRGLPGLFVDVEDPGLFLKQLDAVGALTRLLASDGRSLLALAGDRSHDER